MVVQESDVQHIDHTFTTTIMSSNVMVTYTTHISDTTITHSTMEIADITFIVADITVGIHTGVMSMSLIHTDGTSLLYHTAASQCT